MQHRLPAPSDVIAEKYTVLQELGRGGMGAVFIVAHRLTGKRMALKCLLPEYADNADLVERFVREAQAMGRIEHRHVVDVFDVGRDRNVLYIVMELLDGKPLSDLLHDEQLTLEETLAILVRAMEGVAAAHVHGIIHRDLKPDNIFVCWGASGRLDDPRVLDFGISKLDEGMAQSLTRSGVAMGTPCYMSLEQLSGQRDLDARVDVYAMGVILYEAIAGVPPHTADSVAALAIRVLTTPPAHLAELRPDLPPGLADVVMKAIARDRADRYPNMHALMDAVRPYVPRGAGLLVPEGQGRPLRTPRGAGASSSPSRPSAASRPGGAAGTPSAASRPGGAARTPSPGARPASAPTAARGPALGEAATSALTDAPSAAARAPATAPRAQPGGSPLKWTALGAVGVLLTAAGAWGAITFGSGASGAVRGVPDSPTLPDPVPTPPIAAAPASSAPEPAAAAPDAAAADAAEEPAQAAAGALPPAAADAAEPAKAAAGALPRTPAEQPDAHRAPARTAADAQRKRDRTPDQRPAVAAPATPDAKTAQGRAGKLRSDDF